MLYEVALGLQLSHRDGPNTRHRPPIIIIATSTKETMFLKAKHFSSEVKDAQFMIDILIKVVERVGPTKVAQVITDNALVCKATDLIDESEYDHIFWTPCTVHNLNLIS